MDRISVFLVDDHQLFREGLKLLLSNLPFIGEVREASDGNGFLQALGPEVPDVVFMDIEMPGLNGVDTTVMALERFPGLRVIALSMYGDKEYYTRMIGAGVKGFILKHSGIQEVEEAIHDVMQGRHHFSQEILAGLVPTPAGRERVSREGELSQREEEVLYHICRGYSNREIAGALFLSKRTVDKHRENLLIKTGAKNTAGLVMYAIRSGIIEI
jgi:DNA-binding NarL/FixJ family response regulator